MSRGSRADLAGVALGDGSPIAVMGVINVSPESFLAGSVYRGDDAVVTAALGMVEAGAALIDVGARSSAPYLETAISETEERQRLVRAVSVLAAKLPVPVSADTCRPAVARAALEAGARIPTDVSALAALGRPLCVGVSRKSFVGAITGRDDPAARLAGSLAATAAAVLGGAALIRAHDVAETVDAVRVAERVRRAAP